MSMIGSASGMLPLCAKVACGDAALYPKIRALVLASELLRSGFQAVDFELQLDSPLVLLNPLLRLH